MTKKILFLNPSWEQKALVEEIYKLKLDIIALGTDIPSYSKLFSRYISCKVDDLETIYDVARLNNVSTIISDNCDYSLISSELVCNLLNLPTTGIEAARISNNKILQRERALASNINQPIFKEINILEDALKFIRLIKKDVLIKPIDSRGSIGITFLEKDSNDLLISKAISFALANSPSKRCIIEEYIKGELVTIDGFLVQKELTPIAIAERERSSKGLIVTKSIKYKSKIDVLKKEKYFNFLKDVSKSFNYSNGHIHCEVIIDTKNKIWLVECTNRGAGVFTSSIINPYVSNKSLNNLYIKLKLGEKISIKTNRFDEFKQNNASLMFPSLGKEGQILYSSNYQKICSHPKVLAFKLFSKIGRPLSVQHDGPSRHFAIALSTSDDYEIDDIIKEIKKDYFLIS